MYYYNIYKNNKFWPNTINSNNFSVYNQAQGNRYDLLHGMTWGIQWWPATHQSIWVQSNTGLGRVTSNLTKLVIPLILWRRSDDKLLQSMTSWVWEVSLMDLYHSKIREGALNKHMLHDLGVCAYTGKTVVGPSFMNGKWGFVISSPYLVMVLHRGKALFMELRIRCGSEAWGRNSPTLPSNNI